MANAEFEGQLLNGNCWWIWFLRTLATGCKYCRWEFLRFIRLQVMVQRSRLAKKPGIRWKGLPDGIYATRRFRNYESMEGIIWKPGIQKNHPELFDFHGQSGRFYHCRSGGTGIPGDLDPDSVHVAGIYVIAFPGDHYEKRIEKKTTKIS